MVGSFLLYAFISQTGKPATLLLTAAPGKFPGKLFSFQGSLPAEWRRMGRGRMGYRPTDVYIITLWRVVVNTFFQLYKTFTF